MKYKTRQTPWAEITPIEVKDDVVVYRETYYMSKPTCPVIQVNIENGKASVVSFVRIQQKDLFEIMYGSLEEKDENNSDSNQVQKSKAW